MEKIDLSVIIPAYNEEIRLGPSLEEVKRSLDARGSSYEVIVVDDGSNDRTVEVSEASSLARAGKIKVLSNGRNMGKGFSVKKGVEAASGEFILFSDADMSTPMDEADKLLSVLKNGFDVAIGSRAAHDSRVEVRQPFFRQAMGKVFNFLVRVILGEALSDTQCGFKAFRNPAAKALFRDISIEGFAFDAELLFLARKKGLKVKEVGVIWKNSPISKVSPVSSSINMLCDVLRIRFVHR